MRPPSSAKVASLVVVLALISACSRDEPPALAVAPPSPPPTLPPTLEQPSPSPEPRASLEALNEIRGPSNERVARTEYSLADVVPQTPRRLVFDCSDGVSFAVRMNNDRLALYAPGLPPNGYLTLMRVQSASGVHYRVGDTDFRSDGDLATLEIGHERYVDCVANPAAAVWQELERPDTVTR
jgi:membrane-bound inhibitor of C-type lysozyme